MEQRRRIGVSGPAVLQRLDVLICLGDVVSSASAKGK